jgi:hypothetical protein
MNAKTYKMIAETLRSAGSDSSSASGMIEVGKVAYRLSEQFSADPDFDREEFISAAIPADAFRSRANILLSWLGEHHN